MYLDKNLQTKNKREIEIENFKRDTTHQEKGRDKERELNEIAKTKSGAPEVRRGW